MNYGHLFIASQPRSLSHATEEMIGRGEAGEAGEAGEKEKEKKKKKEERRERRSEYMPELVDAEPLRSQGAHQADGSVNHSLDPHGAM